MRPFVQVGIGYQMDQLGSYRHLEVRVIESVRINKDIEALR